MPNRTIQSLVAEDIIEREQLGIRHYGAPLYASTPDDVDGDPLRQAYHEALDLCVYLRWQIERQSTTP
jgi:hypothetical protein